MFVGLNHTTMSETQSQDDEGSKPLYGASSSATGSGTATFVRGTKPIKLPKRGGVMKQILNDVSATWRSPSPEPAV
ncbi:unnamed protein product [Sphenostylis stenocarpa]|uniref:Uncharacterized protein n=1 Tax=Sphenostylis stenocarpa TaxID=92480 RepID=A0AA86VSA5_9FABA|nr:unnamed protein product [Sphenostylis stenocarpa]